MWLALCVALPQAVVATLRVLLSDHLDRLDPSGDTEFKPSIVRGFGSSRSPRIGPVPVHDHRGSNST